jgi:hypothetical protein
MRHQKGIMSNGTSPYTTTRLSTTTSTDHSRRSPPTRRIRVHTEEVTGSIPVSPTTAEGP